MGVRVLYISYDGVMEPLGQSQVLPYLRKLAKDHEVSLVSYEKPTDWADTSRRNAVVDDTRRAGIRWKALTYHKRPTVLATTYDLAIGFLVCAYLLLRQRIQIVHARSYVPSVLALAFKTIFRKRFIFDMRGFWADERVDGGIWRPGSWLYKAAKWFERRFLMRADVIVSLTHAGVAALCEFPCLKNKAPWFEVITTCTDLGVFRPLSNNPINIGSPARPFTLGIVGSVVSWYLFDPMLHCFKTLRELQPEANLLIVNRDDHVYIRERLAANSVPEARVQIISVTHTDVANEMCKMAAGVFFIKPVLSKVASAPTKLGEFLGCGVPCLANAGVGDVEQVLEGERVGVVLHKFTPLGIQDAVHRLLALTAEPDIKKRCTDVAQRRFSLDGGVQAYDRIYRKLAADAG